MKEKETYINYKAKKEVAFEGGCMRRMWKLLGLVVFWGWSVSDGSAEIVIVDSIGNVGKYCSTDIGWISYYDATNGDLKCAKYPESGWLHISRVDTAGDVGMYTSIDMHIWSGHNPLPVPHISYYDATNGDLKCASSDWAGTQWNIEKVDTTGDVGQYTSIKLDTSYYPHISYYDATNGDLKYASWDGTQWKVEKVDTTGDVGQYSSLALDTLYYPHISYYDATNGDLKCASWDGTQWTIEMVDTAGDVGMYTSIAAAFFAQWLSISYYDVSNGDLKYAEKKDSVWEISRIDSTGDVGKYTSNSGGKNISYYDATNGDLKLASWPVIDSTNDVGLYSSLSMEMEDWFLCYYDITNGDLKCGHWGGGTEEKENRGVKLLSLNIQPNPVIRNAIITYQIDKICNKSSSQLILYNLAGERLKIFEIDNKHGKIYFDTEKLSSGYYFLELTTEKYKKRIKMVVIK